MDRNKFYQCLQPNQFLLLAANYRFLFRFQTDHLFEIYQLFKTKRRMDLIIFYVCYCFIFQNVFINRING